MGSQRKGKQMTKHADKTFLVILAVLLPMVCSGAAEVITLKIGGGHPANTMAYTAVCQGFFQNRVSQRAAAETNYRIEWVEAYAGTVAKLGEGLEACQDGILDILCNSFSFNNRKLYLMNMPHYVPFASPDPVVATKATRETYNKFKDVYDQLWAAYNQKFLAFGPTGHYELITNFPIRTVSDLKGHKIAAAGANLPWLEGSGAVPVQSNLNEAYTCIQTGVYDGWVMWPDASYRFKLHEVAKYYILVNFGANPTQGLSINLDIWEKLPAEIRGIIEESALEYEMESAKAARDWDVEALKLMEKEGVIIAALPANERAEWVANLPNVPQTRATEATELGFPGPAIWNAYMDSQKAQGYVFPREWVVK
jgi:TRAP-type C4-dicarboxylate transport system substrate-binding protein